jgi:transcriptional activator protein UGA3
MISIALIGPEADGECRTGRQQRHQQLGTYDKGFAVYLICLSLNVDSMAGGASTLPSAAATAAATTSSTAASCAPSTTKAPTATDADPRDDRPIRRRFATTGRVRSGCLTCKKRKKKCDDQHWAGDERCQSCLRLGLVCERVPLRTVMPQPQRRKNNSNEDREGRRESVGAGETSGMGTGTGTGNEDTSNRSSPEDHKTSWRSIPRNADNIYNTDEDAVPLSPSSSSPSPSCQAPAPAPRGGSEGDSDIDDFPETPSNGFMALFALDNASPERILLKYYVEHLAPLCSIIQEGSNDFRNVLLPMAIDDSSLLYALFTYASIHVPSSGPIPSITPLMRLKFETQAARGLSEAIRRNSVSEGTIASALICSTAEVVSGDTKRWLVHLQGAGHLLNQLGGPARLLRTSDGRFLLRNFAYHDIMAAFSTGTRPRFRGIYWLDDSRLNSPDCLIGLAHEIIGHVSDICYFIADTKDQSAASPDFASTVTRQGEVLAQALRSQALSICTTLSSSELESLRHHAESYRFAALLHLYRFLSPFAATGMSYATQMSDCVQNIMDHVYQVPLNISCEVGLVFPLFMAGVTCVDDKVKSAYIRSRLENIESWTNFKHIARARELLESLWASGRTDWEALLRKFDWQISLA